MKKSYLLFALMMLTGFAVFAQPGPPGPPAPIDGGIGLLIAAGVAFGAKKIYDHNRASRK
ncbi:MAG: hypothetical protein LPK80_06975 [Bacteroidota bacterium]|nr:hypothetical protein [Bacteroidota bacterium]MDX5404377.1 hypothetical protein [Bacteroidota bacterium]MDX5426968.1 hypothetical protein [Bacteroidota bacterium]MDX5448066.1 hypothetical protein [Bacteroidota bacterium]MDX5504956.1 hypothetical protein [Bacteroidota bacterium]